MMYNEWIRKGTKKPGKSRAGLAAYITKTLKLDPPMSRTAVFKMAAGTRKVHADELEAISKYMEEPIPRIADLIVQADQAAIDIIGNVQVGAWIDPDVIKEGDGKTIVAIKDHMFPTAEHLAYVVKDDSMNGIRVFDGDIIVCVSFRDTRLKLTSGMNVVIERRNGNLLERTLRVVEVGSSNTVEFKSANTNGKEYKSVVMNKAKGSGEKITVIGLLRRAIRDY